MRLVGSLSERIGRTFGLEVKAWGSARRLSEEWAGDPEVGSMV